MGKKTVSQAKNDIKTCLNEIIDPSPSDKERDQIWDHFESQCCYCGESLNRKKREGHLDHLISKNSGGFNHISNRVLSCNVCNGDEKREADWTPFLKSKAKTTEEFEKRKQRIEDWTKKNPLPTDRGDLVDATKDVIEEEFQALEKRLLEAVERVKGEVSRHTK